MLALARLASVGSSRPKRTMPGSVTISARVMPRPAAISPRRALEPLSLITVLTVVKENGVIVYRRAME
jgi:hypothetical protein